MAPDLLTPATDLAPLPALPDQRAPLPAPGQGDGWRLEGPGAGAPLLIALGGMPTVPGTEPAFEFAGLRARLGCTGLLLRDHEQAWYAHGVRGAAPDLPGLADWLRAQVERLRPPRLVLLGNSAGAYAALALGALLDADEVLAYVPRSALSDEVNDALGDDRLAGLRGRVQDAPHVDLVPLLLREHARRDPAPYRTRFRVSCALDNALDRAHAERLSGLPELVVSTYPRGDHQLAAVLRAGGELDRAVAAALLS